MWQSLEHSDINKYYRKYFWEESKLKLNLKKLMTFRRRKQRRELTQASGKYNQNYRGRRANEYIPGNRKVRLNKAPLSIIKSNSDHFNDQVRFWVSFNTLKH